MHMIAFKAYSIEEERRLCIHTRSHTYTYKHTYARIHAHILAHIHAAIYKNGKKGLVFPVLRRVGQL